MAISAMRFIEKLRVHAIELPHAKRKIAFRCFDQEMVVVRHEAICMTDPIIPFIYMLERVEKCFSIMVIFKDSFLFIPTGSHMVDSASIFNTEGARHDATIAELQANCNKRDLTLKVPDSLEPNG